MFGLLAYLIIGFLWTLLISLKYREAYLKHPDMKVKVMFGFLTFLINMVFFPLSMSVFFYKIKNNISVV